MNSDVFTAAIYIFTVIMSQIAVVMICEQLGTNITKAFVRFSIISIICVSNRKLMRSD